MPEIKIMKCNLISKNALNNEYILVTNIWKSLSGIGRDTSL